MALLGQTLAMAHSLQLSQRSCLICRCREPLPKDDKWLTGKEITVEGNMKVKVLHRFHVGAGEYANPGQVIGVEKEMGERLISKGIAEPYKKKKKKGPKVTVDEPEVPEEILEPGWKLKPCDEANEDCPDKKGKK